MDIKLLVLIAAALAPYILTNAEIIRPCNLRDYRCIGDNLQANSYCRRPVKGSIPRQYGVPEFRFETPYFNASYIDRNLIVRNQDRCYVSEFLINTDLNQAVLGIDCPNFDLESDRVLIQHQPLFNDAIYRFHVRGVYPLIRMTVVMPVGNMDLCEATTLTEVLGLPNLNVQPQDRPTANFLTRDLTLLNVYETESFYYRGVPISRIFVESLLCDYGCEIVGLNGLP
nr:fibrohexamerin 1 [Pseudoips prasinana]